MFGIVFAGVRACLIYLFRVVVARDRIAGAGETRKTVGNGVYQRLIDFCNARRVAGRLA